MGVDRFLDCDRKRQAGSPIHTLKDASRRLNLQSVGGIYSRRAYKSDGASQSAQTWRGDGILRIRYRSVSVRASCDP